MATIHKQIFKLGLIVPDENQPRRNFDEAKLKSLMDSIEKNGIMTPLTVEMQQDGTALLIDGERRFRASKKLGLKDVPVTFVEPQDSTQRLIQQFHIQEMHESWSPTERALAIYKLSEELGMTVIDITRVLGISGNSVSRYIAFAKIIDKKNFEKNGVALEYAASIQNLKDSARRACERADIEFDRNTEKSIENAIYNRIQSGVIRSRRDVVKIKDSIVQNPKAMEEFLGDDSITPAKLFSKTGARGAYLYRNLRMNAQYLQGHLKSFIEEDSLKMEKDTVSLLRRTRDQIDNYLKTVSE